jgi:hypothetical protein
MTEPDYWRGKFYWALMQSRIAPNTVLKIGTTGKSVHKRIKQIHSTCKLGYLRDDQGKSLGYPTYAYVVVSPKFNLSSVESYVRTHLRRRLPWWGRDFFITDGVSWDGCNSVVRHIISSIHQFGTDIVEPDFSSRPAPPWALKYFDDDFIGPHPVGSWFCWECNKTVHRSVASDLKPCGCRRQQAKQVRKS